MRRSELKNEIETGIKITPDGWGGSYLMIDKDAVCELMAECFSEPVETYRNDLESEEMRNAIEHTIYELDGKYYAVQENYVVNTGYGRMKWAKDIGRELLFVECANPNECEDGALDIIGEWQVFDS